MLIKTCGTLKISFYLFDTEKIIARRLIYSYCIFSYIFKRIEKLVYFITIYIKDIV